jgi:hypothetical protein
MTLFEMAAALRRKWQKMLAQNPLPGHSSGSAVFEAQDFTGTFPTAPNRADERN